MNPTRWKAVNQIFHAALDLDPADRPAFLQSASQGDPELLSEVQQLLQADLNAGSYLEAPLLPLGPDPSLAPNTLLANRFRILRSLGQGGMGHVYEAFDTELAVHVALKVIQPQIASNPEALARFRQEVRLARQVTHPNICRTFDIDRASAPGPELVFLTMEFLPGQTLAARLQQSGPLPLDLTLALARQIASALQAAHALGIIHRDIKPANIMLVPPADHDQAPRAVLTDFGLARLDPLANQPALSALSQTARPIGTLAYMAPEQLQNLPATPATDIYAFGLVLFEMATGQRAFPSENLLSGIARRLTGPPPSPQSIDPALAPALCRAIESCLQTAPQDRPNSPAEVVHILEGAVPKKPRRRKPPTAAARAWLAWSRWSPRRRLVALAAIFLVAVSLFAAGFRYYRQTVDAALQPGALVYLTRVKNETGEKTLDNLTELLQAGLAQSTQINLLDQSRVGDTLTRMTKPPDTVIDPPTAREIAMRNGAVRVIFASVTGSAGSYSLNIDIQQPDNLPTLLRDHWQQSFRWQAASQTNNGTIPPELLHQVRNAADWIRSKVGESKNDIARLDVPPEDVTTSNWQALQEYAEAERLYREDKKDEAITALRQCVQLDPQFALAFARLGDIAESTGRTSDAYRAYSQALATDFERRITRKELDRIRGIFASDSWDYGAAESAFHDYSVYFPSDYAGWFYRALPLMRLGRFQEAIASLQRAYQLDQHRSSAPFDLASCYLELGDQQSARKWIEVLKQNRNKELAAQLEGTIAFLNGDYSSAETAFQTLSASSQSIYRLRSYSYLSRLLAEQGNDNEALKWIESGIKESQIDGNSAQQAGFLMDRAHIMIVLGRIDQPIDDVQQSLALENSPELLIRASDIFAKGAAMNAARSASKFRAALDRLEQRLPAEINSVAYQIASFRIHSAALLAKGQPEAALKLAQRVVALDSQFRRRDFLARALMAAAQTNMSNQRRQALLRTARSAFAETATHPIAIWNQPSLYSPGALSDDKEGYLLASHELGISDQVPKLQSDR